MSLESEVMAGPMQSIKLAVIGGFIVAFLLICGAGYYFYKQHIADQKTIGKVEEQKADLKQDLVVADTHNEANNAAQSVATKGKNDLDAGIAVIEKKKQDKIKVIEQTVSDPVEKEQQSAEVRMQGIWDTYCLVEPTNASCQVQASQAQSSTGQTQVEGTNI